MHLKPTMLATALTLLLASQAAGASEYSALMKAKKFAEVERVASAKLAQDPANAAAMSARTEAILALDVEARIPEAVKQAEQCVAAQPNSAVCHLALGKALGSKAMHGGMMSAMGYAGTIRDSFKKAVELDPRNMDARFSLLQFYTMAPGIMGGGASKAEALTAQTAALNAEAGKLMQANLDLGDGKLAKAEAAALTARAGTDEDLLDQQEGLLVNLGMKYLMDKKVADAERVFQDAQKRFPDSDNVVYGVARCQQEQGKHREALAALEQVLVKVQKPHVHYRIAQSLQALGDKAKAVAAYEKALSFKSGLQKKYRSDAEDQLKALKG
ncbi:MAG: tetratricopeptide repeat protein [Pseudomonadota bacterium]